MRPIIGVNGDCLWLCGDVCHSPPSLSAPRSHGKLRRRLTGTGVGSNFRFVVHLELKPAGSVSSRVCWTAVLLIWPLFDKKECLCAVLYTFRLA